ncbi:MAG: sigma-70 family RNA polymerase sigma factor [Cyanosarcina radialis HA8281-LM2]|jgi:RNA polymerase sigma-70 factor (ECF subfamily)|nr:sigma-70 family RNA polymerase sigma factor [Cyanosarcina radialis HA8281-LM2]
MLSDLELFQALVAKDPSALAALYDCYGDLMYSLALRILGNRQEAEDLIQEIFLSIWKQCNYNPARGSLRSFLMILVRSRAIDRLRAQKTVSKTIQQQQKESDRFASNSLEEAATDEISERVRNALAQLPEKQRRALELAYYEGLSQSEISQRLDAPLGTVKSWFRLSFAKMRQTLQDLI